MMQTNEQQPSDNDNPHDQPPLEIRSNNYTGLSSYPGLYSGTRVQTNLVEDSQASDLAGMAQAQAKNDQGVIYNFPLIRTCLSQLKKFFPISKDGEIPRKFFKNGSYLVNSGRGNAKIKKKVLNLNNRHGTDRSRSALASACYGEPP